MAEVGCRGAVDRRKEENAVAAALFLACLRRCAIDNSRVASKPAARFPCPWRIVRTPRLLSGTAFHCSPASLPADFALRHRSFRGRRPFPGRAWSLAVSGASSGYLRGTSQVLDTTLELSKRAFKTAVGLVRPVRLADGEASDRPPLATAVECAQHRT